MLSAIQDGSSFGGIEAFLSSLSFVYRFYNTPNFVLDPMVSEVKKFAMKTCEHLTNVKHAFGSAEVRAMWDALDEKYGGVQHLPKLELRTFMIAVFQHQTFCRFSDLAQIRLSDVIHDVDFFKIRIKYSKTDQGGEGGYVFLPKSASALRDPHMLMCIYIHRMDFATEARPEAVYLFPPLR
jgi:integrase